MWNIGDRTEFLGDQGRTGIHIYEAWAKKELPLVGPTVLTGQHLGPAFYYIIAPSLLFTGFHPAMPAVFTALLGVGATYLLWVLGTELFGVSIATVITALWAVSPQIVSSDRVLWEPNIIPFFVLAYLLSLRRMESTFRTRWGFFVGMALGILIQLHYPNLIFIPLTLLFCAGVWVKNRIRKSEQAIFGLFVTLLAGFALAVLPFAVYEFTHRFENITGVFQSSLFSSGPGMGKRQMLANILDYGGRVIRRAFPIPAGWEAAALFFFFAGVLFSPYSFWK